MKWQWRSTTPCPNCGQLRCCQTWDVLHVLEATAFYLLMPAVFALITVGGITLLVLK